MPIIAAAQDTGTATVSAAWNADLHVRYVRLVPPVPPVLPATRVMATVRYMMTPIMTPVHPMVSPPPEVMSPSSPLWTEKLQVDEVSLDNELL